MTADQADGRPDEGAPAAHEYRLLASEHVYDGRVLDAPELGI